MRRVPPSACVANSLACEHAGPHAEEFSMSRDDDDDYDDDEDSDEGDDYYDGGGDDDVADDDDATYDDVDWRCD